MQALPGLILLPIPFTDCLLITFFFNHQQPRAKPSKATHVPQLSKDLKSGAAVRGQGGRGKPPTPEFSTSEISYFKAGQPGILA